MISFQDCEKKVEFNTNAYMVLDVLIHWNSTYLMLQSDLKYKHVAMLALNDSHYKCCPSNEELKRGEGICEYLIFGSIYLIANLLFA